MNDFPMNEPEQNDPEISDNLRRIVPDDLSTAGLVAGAQGKRRRRSGIVGVLAALALVAVAVPVALNLPSNDNLIAEPAASSSSMQSADPGAGVVLPGARACYNDDGTPVSWTEDKSGPAEPGAVRAWFCGDYSPETGRGFVGPIEPLTSGLDDIIDDVQAADEIDLAVMSCMSGYNLSFSAVFEYEDGTRRVIGGERQGCRGTYDGGVTRAGADEFYGALYAAWEKQRETDTGDWVVPHVCPGPLSLIEMESGDAVQASVCREKEDGSWAATYLGRDLVAEVAQELRASLDSPDVYEFTEDVFSQKQQIWLTLSNKFTDYQTWVRYDDGMYVASLGEGREQLWQPSVELTAKLDDALAAAGSTESPPAGKPVDGEGVEDPDESVLTEPGLEPAVPQPWVPEGCEGVTSEDALNSELPEGELPEGADRIWLCAGDDFSTGITPPMEALEDPGAVEAVVAAFNDLEPMSADLPCTMELGPSWLVAHEYADGTKHTVKMEEFGCRAVLSGGTMKVDSQSSSYKESLLDAWNAQRVTRNITQTRPGPLCYLSSSSLMPVDPEKTTFTSGVACPAGEDGVVTEEKPIPADVLALLNGQLKEARPTSDYVITAGNALILLNPSGDPLRLSHEEDGTFYWDDGVSMNSWKPDGEIAEKLMALFE